MKLVLITSSAPFGPGEEFVLEEAGALSDSGADVFIVPVLKRQAKMRSSETPASITVAGKDGVLSPEILGVLISDAIRRPVRVLRALALVWTWQPIKLSKNLIVFPKGVWLARLCQRQGFFHIHAAWASSSATVAMVASQLSGIPWSFTAHRGDIVENNLLCRKLQRASFARFISERSMQLAARYCPSLSGCRRLLHVGVHLPPKPSWPVAKEGKFIICCPANMLPVKGHQVLINALATLDRRHEIELWLAGSGPMRQDLEQQAKQLGLSHAIRFLGQLRHDELLNLYAESRIQLVVLPSLDLGNGIHEGIPVSLMEAMSYGVPVISTTSGGIPELLNDGAGLLVRPANIAELASAIQTVRNDHNLRKLLGVAGRQKVAEHFNLASVATTLVSWIRDARLQD